MSILDSARLLTEEQSAATVVTDVMEVEDDTEWVTDIYSQLNGTPMHNVSTRWQRLNKYRLFIGAVSLLLVSLCVALVVPRSSCVSSFIPSMGTDCASVTTLSYITAGLLGVTGLVGCLACYQGLRLTLSCCLATLFFCYAVLCGISAGSVVYSRLHQLANLESAWRQLVAAKSPVVCDVENTLQCSGFAEGQCCVSAPLMESNDVAPAAPAVRPPPCFLQAMNGSTYDARNLSAITWPSTMCLSSCLEWNERTALVCAVPLKSIVKNYFLHFVLILSGLTVLCAALGCITIAGMCWKPSIDSRMQHRF
jgi:hypothetical protein